MPSFDLRPPGGFIGDDANYGAKSRQVTLIDDVIDPVQSKNTHDDQIYCHCKAHDPRRDQQKHSPPSRAPIGALYWIAVRGERRIERRSKAQLVPHLLIVWPTQLHRRHCRTRSRGADSTGRRNQFSQCDNGSFVRALKQSRASGVCCYRPGRWGNCPVDEMRISLV